MKFLPFCLLFVSVCSWAQRGGMDGGGGDHTYLNGQGSGWIDLTRPIRYCISQGSVMTDTNEQLQERVQASFQMWFSYVQEKKINLYQLKPETTLRLQYAGNCADEPQSTEDAADVQFYFSAQSQTISAQLEKYPDRYAMAYGMVEATRQKQGKGWIWITDLTEGGKATKVLPLNPIILHEIGHALGNGHATDTIMDEQLFLKISRTADLSTPNKFFKIDQQAELYSCLKCLVSRTMSLEQADPYVRKTFRDVLKIGDLGTVTLQLNPVKALPPDIDPGYYSTIPQKGRLVVQNGDQTKAFEINLNLSTLAYGTPGATTFKLYLEPDLNRDALDEVNREFRQYPSTAYGSLTSESGEQWTLIIERNTTALTRGPNGDLYDLLMGLIDSLRATFERSPLKLFILKDGVKYRLFGGTTLD